MDKLLPWISYVNALGLGLIAAMVTALAIMFIPIPGAPDWILWAVFLAVAVGYGLFDRSQSEEPLTAN